MNVDVPCLCPPVRDEVRHPDGDTIVLRDKLSFRLAVSMQKSVATLRLEVEDPTEAEMLGALTESYVLLGIESWTLVDAKGKPLPVTRSTITERLLECDDLSVPMRVADVADDLYQAVVLLPLVQRASESSETTPTTESTSQTTSSPDEHPRPLRRSSTTSSQTDDTETTSASPDGDSSSSQNSASAA